MAQFSKVPSSSRCGVCKKRFEFDSDIFNHVEEDHLLRQDNDSPSDEPIAWTQNAETLRLEKELENQIDRLKRHLAQEESGSGQTLPVRMPDVVECSTCGETYLNKESVQVHVQLVHAPALATKSKRGRPKKNRVLGEMFY
jgi:excinuclease UvrABC ATPase subunit